MPWHSQRGAALLTTVMMVVSLSLACRSPCTCTTHSDHIKAVCERNHEGLYKFNGFATKSTGKVYYLTLKQVPAIPPITITEDFVPPADVCVTRIFIEKEDIERIDMDAFSAQSSCLQQVDLSGNRISNLTAVTASLAGLPQLNLVDLDYNKIRSVKSDIFSSFSSLQRLELAHNELTSSSFMEAALPPSLTDALLLGGNTFTDLGFLAYQNFKTLDSLRLEQASVRTIPRSAFARLTSLIDLRLPENVISVETIEAGAFDNLERLEILNLYGNHLETLPESVFKQVLVHLSNNALRKSSHMKTALLNVTANPFVCDCRMAWLRELTLKYDPLRANCASPPSVKGESIYTFPLDVSQCQKEAETAAPPVVPTSAVLATPVPIPPTPHRTPAVNLPSTQMPSGVGASTRTSTTTETPELSRRLTAAPSDGSSLSRGSDITTLGSELPRDGAGFLDEGSPPESITGSPREGGLSSYHISNLLTHIPFLAASGGLVLAVLILVILSTLLCKVCRANAKLRGTRRERNSKREPADLHINEKLGSERGLLTSRLHSSVSSVSHAKEPPVAKQPDLVTLRRPVKATSKQTAAAPAAAPTPAPAPADNGYYLRNTPNFNSKYEDMYLQVMEDQEDGYECIRKPPQDGYETLRKQPPVGYETVQRPT